MVSSLGCSDSCPTSTWLPGALGLDTGELHSVCRLFHLILPFSVSCLIPPLLWDYCPHAHSLTDSISGDTTHAIPRWDGGRVAACRSQMEVGTRGCFYVDMQTKSLCWVPPPCCLPRPEPTPSLSRAGVGTGHGNSYLPLVSSTLSSHLFLLHPLSIFIHCGLQKSASFSKDGLDVSCSHCLGAIWEETGKESLYVAILNGSCSSILEASVSLWRQTFYESLLPLIVKDQ